jgi:hypothetical protein
VATASRVISTANGGLCVASYTYDDVTLAVESITLANNGASGTLSAIAATLAVEARLVPAGPGQTKVIDLTGLGLLMANVTLHGLPLVDFPGGLIFRWSSV